MIKDAGTQSTAGGSPRLPCFLLCCWPALLFIIGRFCPGRRTLSVPGVHSGILRGIRLDVMVIGTTAGRRLGSQTSADFRSPSHLSVSHTAASPRAPDHFPIPERSPSGGRHRAPSPVEQPHILTSSSNHVPSPDSSCRALILPPWHQSFLSDPVFLLVPVVPVPVQTESAKSGAII